MGQKFHFEQARAAHERFDWGRSPRLPPRHVPEAGGGQGGGEAPRSTGTIKTTFKSIADPPGLEQLLHAQHSTAAAGKVQRLAAQHRGNAVLLQKALQVLVWVMTAVRQEAFDLLLLVVALCAEDTRLQAAGQPPNPERFRGQSSIAEGFRRQRQRACGSDHSHHVTNDAAQRALRGFPDLDQRVMKDCITAVTTSEHHREAQHRDQRAGRDPHSHNLAQYVYGHVFQVHRSEDRVGPPRSVTGLTSVVDLLARQMETNVGVHLATNLFRWLKTRCRVQLHRTLHPEGEAVVQPPVRELGFVDLLALYAAPAWRQKRLQVYCQKQRVLCREAVRLMGGEPEVTQQKGVVGWGGGSAGYHGIVSRAGQPPRKEFVRLLRERFARHVIVINEYHTSMVCANCGRLSLRRKQLPQGGADFHVLVCNDCHTTWDRDENAALNMRLLLVLQLLGRDRPAVFCRQEGGVD